MTLFSDNMVQHSELQRGKKVKGKLLEVINRQKDN